MITVKEFVGSFMHSLALSRAMADKTSLQVAHKYLQDEYLRGFPVPKMSIHKVDLELKFGVGPKSSIQSMLKEPIIVNNIVHQLRNLLTGLPQTQEFKDQFSMEDSLENHWFKGIHELIESIEKILEGTISDKVTLVHTLCLAVENFFYQLHAKRPEHGVLSGLKNIFHKESSSPQNNSASDTKIRDWVSTKITAIIDSAIPTGIGGVGDCPDLNILVGAQDLDGANTDALHTAKITVTCEDRKWVAVDQDGEKKYILDRK